MNSGIDNNSDYASLIGRIRTEDPYFNKYIHQIAAGMRFMNGINPRNKEPMKPLDEKVDSFLIKYAGINYKDFAMYAKPEDFNTNDYALLSKKTLKRRLFDYRAKLYISALADCEKEGYDLGRMLMTVKSNKIPYLKKEEHEPTYDKILQILGKK